MYIYIILLTFTKSDRTWATEHLSAVYRWSNRLFVNWYARFV